ncbi:expressed unknown protein [Seminavis robusta]|uniref:Uncharacterized protein n=1 Tax=Seminavis robusta TaxID=568900 RepID=A0A9N8E1K9_9STRA|nr:expressed unknown protein [Seminavis robusta]|eukprot:Sro556_g165980.1 n/a (324) ;mRNA; r:41278-42249
MKIPSRSNVLLGGLLLLSSSPSPAVASPFASYKNSNAFVPRSPQQSTASVLMQIPRGGAWYFGKRTAARRYRELLEEQVTMLDRQLRQSQEELALLRRQLKTSQSILHRSGLKGASAEGQANKLAALTENQDLKKRVASLAKEILQLEKMRDELEAIIQVQHMKMEELEAKLQEKELANQNLVAKYEREMQSLKLSIESKYQKQIADLTNLMNKRVEEAAEHARQVALRELDAKVSQATQAERQRGEKLLEDERKRSEAAVEREKVKMRKLAKALFEREKKLNTLDKDVMEVASSSSSSTVKSSSFGSKTGNATYKVDTIRKF